ncbi:thioredoxin domain-containing protein [soil metagenome]
MARSTPERSSLTPLYVILGVVALAGIGVLLFQLSRGDPGATEPVPVTLDPQELSRVQGISRGSADAPVVILEFADFQCPGCEQFATFVSPLIEERLVEPGLVRYVHYDFPLVSIHAHAFLAARAGRCALEQDRFWGYHDILYARQTSWSSLDDPTDEFVEYAGELGLNGDEFAACLRSDRYAEEVTRSMRFGESLDVPGTPTLIVNGKRLAQTPSFAELEQIVRQEAGLTTADSAASASAG